MSTVGAQVERHVTVQVDQTLATFIDRLKLQQTSATLALQVQPPTPAGSATKAPVTTQRSIAVPGTRRDADKALLLRPLSSKGAALGCQVAISLQSTRGSTSLQCTWTFKLF